MSRALAVLALVLALNPACKGRKSRAPEAGVLVASQGGAPEHPQWYHNLKADPNVEIRDKDEVYRMRDREIVDPVERKRLWDIAVEVFPPYQDYQNKTDRIIPVFIAEPVK